MLVPHRDDECRIHEEHEQRARGVVAVRRHPETTGAIKARQVKQPHGPEANRSKRHEPAAPHRALVDEQRPHQQKPEMEARAQDQDDSIEHGDPKDDKQHEEDCLHHSRIVALFAQVHHGKKDERPQRRPKVGDGHAVRRAVVPERDGLDGPENENEQEEPHRRGDEGAHFGKSAAHACAGGRAAARRHGRRIGHVDPAVARSPWSTAARLGCGERRVDLAVTLGIRGAAGGPRGSERSRPLAKLGQALAHDDEKHGAYHAQREGHLVGVRLNRKADTGKSHRPDKRLPTEHKHRDTLGKAAQHADPHRAGQGKARAASDARGQGPRLRLAGDRGACRAEPQGQKHVSRDTHDVEVPRLPFCQHWNCN